VWWLWAATVGIHLLLLVGVIMLSPAEMGDTSVPVLMSVGMLNTALLTRRPRDVHPFPWQRYQVRVQIVVRRRRMSELSMQELLSILPPGVRTVAQLVDWLTRHQTVKLLASLPLLYPILTELKVEEIINRLCPTEAEYPIGVVVVVLCLNRLIAPKPLSGITEWATKIAIEELVGIPASKLNDDRLGRALDAIYPHLETMWTEIVSRALQRYNIDLNLIFYDTTAFYFEGEYAKSQCVRFGFSRSHRGKKQAKLAINVTGREKFPFLYRFLDGNTADVATVQANMQQLLKVLQSRGWPVDQVLVVGDRAMLSAEIVQAYQRAGLKYLSALKVMGETEQALIRSVTPQEWQNNRLDDEHWGVKRPYAFEPQGEPVPAVALITLSRTLQRRQRSKRVRYVRARLETLRLIEQERLNRRKYKRKSYAEEQITKQVLQQPGGEFLQVQVIAQADGTLRLRRRVNWPAARDAMALDGKFILVTNDSDLDAADMVSRYVEKDKVEKANRVVKGVMRVRPVFLHSDQRIEALVFINMLALLTYSVLEMKCRRQGLILTAERVLKGFAPLAMVYSTFRDSSVRLHIEPLNHFQRQVVLALGQARWPALADLVTDAPLSERILAFDTLELAAPQRA